MKQKIQKIVVGAIIVDDNKILILKRSKDEEILPNLWELPSGKVDFGESVEKSLIRETKEETGLDVRTIEPISTFDYIIENKDKIKHTVQINFLVRKLEGKVKISNEHDDFYWLPEEKLEKYNISQKTKNVIKIAFRHLNK